MLDGCDAAVGAPAPDEQSARAPLARRPPKVSIVIPCHDSAETVRGAYQSLRRQTLRDWEAIFVDDGSTDETVEIVRNLVRYDVRVRLLRQAWGGVSRARNAGVAAATAPWILFLDSDDWLARTALARLLGAAAQRPRAGVIVGRTTVVLPSGRRGPFPVADLSDPFASLCSECRIAIHSALVRRGLVTAVGGFDASLRSHEDWDLWQRLARVGVEFAQISATVAFYRSRPESLSRGVRRATEDGLLVMRRGHGADPRLRSVPGERGAGAQAAGLPSRELFFLLWSAARDVALGGDGQAILALRQGPPPVDVAPEDLGELIAAGMADVLAVSPERLGARWPEFAPKLAALLAAARLDEGGRRASSLILATAQARLNGRGADEVRVDARLPPEPPETEPPAVLQIRGERAAAGAVALPSLGQMSRARLASTLVAQLGRLPLAPALRALRPWRSPRFVVGVARDLFVARGAIVGAPNRLNAARLRVRRVLRDQMQAFVGRRLAGGLEDRRNCDHAAQFAALEAQAGTRSSQLAKVPRDDGAPTGRPAIRSFARYGGVEIPVLTYHRVADDAAAGLERHCLPPQRFREQIEYLKSEGFTGITPDELAAALLDAAPLPQRPVLLTFDDGYLDFAQNAWPVLSQAGYPATLFIAPQKVGGHADWDEARGAPAPLLDWPQIARLAADGVSIGSQGFTRRRLTQLDVPSVYAEALDARAAIEQVLERRPLAFGYPFGARDSAVERIVEECGYRLGFTTMPGLCSPASSPMRLPRKEIRASATLASFARELSPHAMRLADPPIRRIGGEVLP